MLDLKLPTDMPFKKQMLLTAIWGLVIGTSLGIGLTITVLIAIALNILPQTN